MAPVSHDTARTDPEEFLRNAGQIARIDANAGDDPRALELINKTNQFNLNGVRLTDKVWSGLRSGEGVVIVTVDYEDKFGPLKKIAVLAGEREGDELVVATGC